MMRKKLLWNGLRRGFVPAKIDCQVRGDWGAVLNGTRLRGEGAEKLGLPQIGVGTVASLLRKCLN